MSICFLFHLFFSVDIWVKFWTTLTKINTQVFLFPMMLQKSNLYSFLSLVFTCLYPSIESWTCRGRHIIWILIRLDLFPNRERALPVPFIPNQRLFVLVMLPRGVLLPGCVTTRIMWIETMHSTLLSTTAPTTLRRYPRHLSALRTIPRTPPLSWLLSFRNQIGRSLLNPKS